MSDYSKKRKAHISLNYENLIFQSKFSEDICTTENPQKRCLIKTELHILPCHISFNGRVEAYKYFLPHILPLDHINYSKDQIDSLLRRENKTQKSDTHKFNHESVYDGTDNYVNPGFTTHMDLHSLKKETSVNFIENTDNHNSITEFHNSNYKRLFKTQLRGRRLEGYRFSLKDAFFYSKGFFGIKCNLSPKVQIPKDTKGLKTDTVTNNDYKHLKTRNHFDKIFFWKHDNNPKNSDDFFQWVIRLRVDLKANETS